MDLASALEPAEPDWSATHPAASKDKNHQMMTPRPRPLHRSERRRPSAITKAIREAADADEARRLGRRVEEVHGELDRIAQRKRTTVVMSTKEGSDVVASGKRDLSPAQRAVLTGDEIPGKLPGEHGEVTALDSASKNGLRVHVCLSRAL